MPWPRASFRNGHLGEFKFAGSYCDQGATANHHAIQLCQTDFSALGEDPASRVAEHFAIAGLEREVAADPSLVQFFEWLLIAGLKPAQHQPAG